MLALGSRVEGRADGQVGRELVGLVAQNGT